MGRLRRDRIRGGSLASANYQSEAAGWQSLRARASRDLPIAKGILPSVWLIHAASRVARLVARKLK